MLGFQDEELLLLFFSLMELDLGNLCASPTFFATKDLNAEGTHSFAAAALR